MELLARLATCREKLKIDSRIAQIDILTQWFKTFQVVTCRRGFQLLRN
jgi:hypothetical protein